MLDVLQPDTIGKSRFSALHQEKNQAEVKPNDFSWAHHVSVGDMCVATFGDQIYAHALVNCGDFVWFNMCLKVGFVKRKCVGNLSNIQCASSFVQAEYVEQLQRTA